MTCRPFADALVDSSVPRPEGLEGHLAGCADCRALAQGHSAATRLAGVELPPHRAVRPGALLPRLAAVAALLLAAGAWLLVDRPPGDRLGNLSPSSLSPSSSAAEVAPAVDPREGPALAAEPEDDWAALAALHQQTSAYARSDADALLPYRGMPGWFALQRLQERVDALSSLSPEVPQ